MTAWLRSACDAMPGQASEGALPVLVVTGLAREARIARGAGVLTVVSGGDTKRLRTMLAEELPRCAAVVSFGIAAGLDPILQPGDVVVATTVLGGDRSVDATSKALVAFSARLEPLADRITFASVFGADVPALDVATKARMRQATGASAIDMESHVAADFAQRHGLPFVALRAICDPAGHHVPPYAAMALNPDGTTNAPAVIRALMRKPGELPQLLRLARDASASFRALGRCRRLLGVGFGLADLG